MFETSDTSPVEGVELGDFVRARARLEHAPDNLPAVVTMLKLPDAEAWHRVERTWRARMESDRRLARVVDEFVEDHVRELRGVTDVEEGATDTDAASATPSAPVVQQAASYMQLGAMGAPVTAAPPLVPPPVFVAAPPAPLPASPPPLAAPPAAVASAPARRVPLGETAPLDFSFLRDVAAKGPTPFAGKTSPEQLQKLRGSSIAAEETQLQRPAAGADEADETAMYQPTPSQRVGFQTLPFDAAKGKHVFPEMDVDAYAAFVAQLEVHADHASILLKHGITTPKGLLALRAEQERRFEQDPARRARFEERKAHFRSFMKSTR
jgi:hypothetical protein